jgi:tetratricopeptide (TPR) repeat protein
MGFFNKFFGGKDKGETEGAQGTGRKGGNTSLPQGADFVAALSLQLSGELDEAFAAYVKLAEEAPQDNLSTFFASSIMAGKGGVSEAASNLRSISQRISSSGDSISRVISTELFEAVLEHPAVRIPAVTDLVLAFAEALKPGGFLQESAVCFEIAASLVPGNAHVLHKFGDILHDLRMYDYAEEVLQGALRLASHHWGALYTYAVLLHDLGRNEEALAYYERAVKVDPNHANCRNNYCSALMSLGRFDEALEQCSLAAELAPEAPLVKVNLGNVHLMKQNYDEARACFEAAVSLDANLAQAHFGLGAVEQKQGGDSKRVREHFQKAIELAPAIPQFHHALAKLLAGEGDQEALTHFAAAEKLDQALRDLQRDFGSACLGFGRWEEGLKHLETALEQNPEDALARDILAMAKEQAPA